MHMFSIVMPVYNLERYVSAALDSVLAQTFTDWECICVDDGSTDESGRILDAYAQRDSRIRVIHQQNGGEGAARDSGIRVAHGEWLAFLDGDDLWHPNLLEYVSIAVKDFPDARRIGFHDVLFPDGNSFAWTFDGLVPKMYVSNFCGQVTRSFFEGGLMQFVYYRPLLNGMQFRPYVVGTDLVFRDECVVRTPNCIMIEAVLYGYRQRQGSAMRVALTRRKFVDSMYWFRDRLRIVCRMKCPVERGLCRDFWLRLVEWISWDYYKLSENDRSAVRSEWFSILSEMHTILPPPLYFRIVLKVALCFRSDAIVRVLFWLPMYLKRKGIHR